MMKYIILLALGISSMANGQEVNALFEKANQEYKNGKYEDALSLYQEIEATDKISSALYYNMGNCFYKMNVVPASIYNFEKALVIDPSNEDAINNLEIAKKLTLDRIEALPKNIFQKFNSKYIAAISFNSWAYISVALSLLAGILFILFYFAINSSLKRLYFILFSLSILFLIGTLFITSSQYSIDQNSKYAIVFEKEISIKNEPTRNSEEIFLLHEGTKVRIIDTLDDWSKIKLLDGKIGWLKTSEIKVI